MSSLLDAQLPVPTARATATRTVFSQTTFRQRFRFAAQPIVPALRLLARRACFWAALVALAAPALVPSLRAAVTEAWVQRYNGPGYDVANAVAVDADGNVVVTGTSSASYFTAKYAAANGMLLWERRYFGSGNTANAVAVDDVGNVVVTGVSANDYYTVKYAAADGALLWERRYNGPAHGNDVANAVVVDGNGDVVVTGYSHNSTGTLDYYTAKYAGADGTPLWEHRGPADYFNSTYALAVDSSGNVVVTGSSGRGGDVDYYTAKYAAADGALLWERRYNGPGNKWDLAHAVAVDGSGNVVVTGRSNNGFDGYYDYYTAKYAAANGAVLWEKRYNGPASGPDIASAVAVDGSGNVIVTGNSYGTSGYSDYYTAKYAAADGTLLWEKRYHSPGPGAYGDEAYAVAVDESGNVIVTGNSVGNGSNSDYYTAKYAGSNGALLWEKRYNGPADGYDYVGGQVPWHCLALGPNGMVAVTGSSDGAFGLGINDDYATIVYRENLPPIITSCPVNTVTNATGRHGAVVTFTFTATDDSGVPPTIICSPPNGSIFPIGQTTVTCTATDSDALSSSCSFTVTVLGARAIKENLLAELIALRATVTVQNDSRNLDAAIRYLTRSLTAKLWVDETHLSRKHGRSVFREERLTVRRLCRSIKSRTSDIPDAQLQAFVDRVFQADRLLATVAIHDAIIAVAPNRKIDQSQRFLARGDAASADGKCDNGIGHYRNAWKRAVR